MTRLARIAARLDQDALAIFGGFHPDPQDGAPEGCATLLMLGPRAPDFWPRVTASAEFADGAPDPLDRWSARVIGTIAADLGAAALFPFAGPPWPPFFRWALRSGRAWRSPVNLLVHDTAGLWVSYRGALALPDRLDLPDPPACPCDSCATRPCLTACPVGALRGGPYDLDACHGFLDSEQGNDCLEEGCKVRRDCPVSQRHGRPAEQSAFHMRAFHP